MSSTNSTMEAFDPPAKANALPFLVLCLVAAGLCAVALWQGHAPLDPYPIDWVNWARIEPTWAGVFACGIILFIIGMFGTFMAVFPASKAKVKAERQAAPARSKPAMAEASPVAAPAAVLAAVPAMDDPLDVPSSEGLGVAQRAPETRGSLKFDAQRLSAGRPETSHDEAVTAPLFASAPTAEMPSLEPAIFHDNASDSFMPREPEAVAEPTQEPVFDAAAALSETHGLGIARAESAQIIPIRPDISVLGADLAVAADPLEAALLAEPTAAPRPAPQSDMNAVISSAMRFIETPVEDGHAVQAVETIPVVEAPAAEAAAPAADDEAEIRQAVQTALSVWPESTRAIAADELGARIGNLYYDPTPQSRQIFQLIASGDLSAASTALQAQADALTHDGRAPEAAELWRVCGALHMGRDDGKALAAYEKVSELDPSDANIHLYLFRRYQMAGETAKQPGVIARALGVISDPSIRTELLTPYADLQMKAGQVQAAGDALEELSRLHETTAYLRPDDIAARSAHAITVARLAQAREMQGAFDQAGPLYKRAHQAFADLSAMKPEHPGLKAMAENALKDARRFGA